MTRDCYVGMPTHFARELLIALAAIAGPSVDLDAIANGQTIEQTWQRHRRLLKSCPMQDVDLSSFTDWSRAHRMDYCDRDLL
jgi:hypothetical protein